MQQTNSSLSLFAKLTVVAAFALLVVGSLVTTNGAGMAFPDWPLSNGSLNPQGWLTNLLMFLEHSHRLIAGTVATLVAVLFFWVIKARASLKRGSLTLAILALAGVLAQALLGGFRVTVESSGHPEAALVIRVVHACLAQIEFSLLVILAAWLSARGPETLPQIAGAKRIRNLAWLTFGFIFLQLVVGATMRHMGAGLAIPFFPHASQTGAWMPPIHSAYIDINFTHTRVLAILVGIHVLLLVSRVLRSAPNVPMLRRPALLLLALTAVQIGLGILIIWSLRGELITTLHVVNGAIVLATSFLIALRASQLTSSASDSESRTHDFPGQEAVA